MVVLRHIPFKRTFGRVPPHLDHLNGGYSFHLHLDEQEELEKVFALARQNRVNLSYKFLFYFSAGIFELVPVPVVFEVLSDPKSKSIAEHVLEFIGDSNEWHPIENVNE